MLLSVGVEKGLNGSRGRDAGNGQGVEGKGDDPRDWQWGGRG